MTEERGIDFAKRHRARNGFACNAVGRADDLAMFELATSHKGTVDLWPMIATDDVADLRRAPELAQMITAQSSARPL